MERAYVGQIVDDEEGQRFWGMSVPTVRLSPLRRPAMPAPTPTRWPHHKVRLFLGFVTQSYKGAAFSGFVQTPMAVTVRLQHRW